MSNLKSIKPTEWYLVISLYVTLFVLGLLDNIRAPFYLDIIKDLSLSDTLASLFFVTVSATAYFTGKYLPKIKEKLHMWTIFRFAQVAMAVGFFAISRADNYPLLLFFCFIFGLGFGLINVAQNLLIIDNFSGQVRRRLLSGLHGMYALSSLFAPLAAAQMYNWGWTWRSGFMALGVLALLSSVSALFVEKKNVQQLHHDNSVNIPFKKYALFGFVFSFYVISEIMLATRMPLYARRVLGYSPEAASVMLASFFSFLLVGRFIFLAMHIKLKNVQVLDWGLILSFCLVILGLYVHPFFLCLCGLTMAPIFALSLDFLAELYSEHSSQVISSVIAMSCLLIVSAHLLVGYLTDLLGIGVAMNFCLLSLLMAWLLLKKMTRSQEKVIL